MKLENPKTNETFAYKMFGKRFCELNEFEKKQYLNMAKNRSREKYGKNVEGEYHLKYFKEHKEHLYELRRKWVNSNANKMAEYSKKSRTKKRGCDAGEDTVAFKVFGKRLRDMDDNEKKKYYAYLKRIKYQNKNV